MSLFCRRKKPIANTTPDLFVRTTDGGFVTMQGGNARHLGDAIQAVIQGKAMIVLTGYADPMDRIWRHDDE
jgi:hypothetical protein